ncbi:MAG TPA: XdhC/CoxI family protein [Mycobacteriales bacterium]|nr:XdhC/CoxI family protein [Mycobacteriales bacterium]
MRDLLDSMDAWRRDGRRIALARVVEVAGSGPRDPGAAMAVNDLGEVIGSVSGGCVEGAVVEAAQEVIETGTRGLRSFGYSDSDAFAVGLTCGGTIGIYLEPLDEATYDELADEIRAVRPAALATVVGGVGLGRSVVVCPNRAVRGSLGNPDLDRVVTRDALGELASASTRIRRYGSCGEGLREDVAVFIESFAPPPRMVIFGAIDFTAALVKVAKLLGYRVTVCDARSVFATAARFPLADEVIVDWPHRLLESIGTTLTSRDAICVLTHDLKFDVPAIVAALGTEAGYIGAMGSRRTHRERIEHLREAGVGDAGLARLHSPIGLALGGRTPEETAVAVCAEIIATRNGLSDVRPLSATEGPIHPPRT